MMEIIETEGLYKVAQNGEILYEAKSLAEAEGYVAWKNRSDAGNTPEDCGCN
jgi:hypothetical protein